MGTSMAKYITSLPCIDLSESDSNYTLTLNFVKEKHKHLKIKLICKVKQSMLTFFFSQKVYMF